MTNPLQLRQFDPEFLANFQKGLVELLGLSGKEALPAIFKLPVAVALTDNAADQLCQRHGITTHDERAKHVAAALERYKRRVQYHYAMLKGEAKYDLDMQKAGEITDRERRGLAAPLRAPEAPAEDRQPQGADDRHPEAVLAGVNDPVLATPGHLP